jgi:hypothetical protein
VKRLLLLLLAAPVTMLAVAACAPQDMTVHGTVELTAPFNVPPPVQDLGNGITYTPPVTVNITADDGPGNYSGQPWNGTQVTATLARATAKMLTYTFTARVAGDAEVYQIDVPCCYTPDTSLSGETYTIEQMQAGPVVCIGNGCPPGG